MAYRWWITFLFAGLCMSGLVSGLFVSEPLNQSYVSLINVSWVDGVASFYNASLYNSSAYIATLAMSGVVDSYQNTSEYDLVGNIFQLAHYRVVNNSFVSYVSTDNKIFVGGVTGFVLSSFTYTDGSSANSSVSSYNTTSYVRYYSYNPLPFKQVSYIRTYIRTDGGASHAAQNFFNFTSVSDKSFSVDLHQFNLSVGGYFVNVSGFNSSGSFLLSNVSSFFTLSSNAFISLSVFNSSGGSPSYTVSYSGGSVSGSGSVLLPVVVGSCYNLSVDAAGYALNVSSVCVSSFGSTPVSVYLLPNNAVNLSVRSESSGGVILQNVSLSFIGDSGVSVSSSINGSGVVAGLPADDYALTVSTSGYSLRSYRLSVPDRSFQNMNVYLNNGTAVAFNFYQLGGSTLNDATLLVYAYVGGSLVLVESVDSQLGVAQVALESSRYYYFVAFAEGFVNNTFSLNPVSYSSYDIVMSPLSAGEVVPSASVSWSPTIFTAKSNAFVLTLSSPHCSISSAYFNLSYTGGSVANSSTVACGEVFSRGISLTPSMSRQYVTLYYSYLLSNGASYNSTVVYSVVVATSNRTMMDVGTNRYGLLIGDRIFWVGFIALIFAAVGFMALGFGGAVIGGSFIWFIFAENTFVPEYVAWVVIVIGVLLIIMRGGQNG